jgi:hypothetical protein
MISTKMFKKSLKGDQRNAFQYFESTTDELCRGSYAGSFLLVLSLLKAWYQNGSFW